MKINFSIKFFLIAGISTIFSILMGSLALAQNVSLNQVDDVIQLTSGNFVISSDAPFGSLVVNENSVVITRGTAGSVIFRSNNKYNLANDKAVSISCLPDGAVTYSQLSITGADPVTITPVAEDYCASLPAPAPAPAPVVSSGGGGGPTVTAGSQTTQVSVRPSALEVTYPSDVSASDELYSVIREVVDLLVAKNAYLLPGDNKYDGLNAVTWTYLAQTALAIKGLPCEGGVTPTNCRESAKKNSLIPKYLTSKVPTRLDIYNSMLVSLNVDRNLARANRVTLAFLCRDYSRSQGIDENLDLTAEEKVSYGGTIKLSKMYRFASLFKSRRCYLDKAMRRNELISVAKKTLDIQTGAVKPIMRPSNPEGNLFLGS